MFRKLSTSSGVRRQIDNDVSTKTQIEKLSEHYEKGISTLEAAKRLTENREYFFDNIAKEIISNGSIPNSERKSFLSFFRELFQVITYCLIANSSEPLNLYLSNDIGERGTRHPFMTHSSEFINALNAIKKHHHLTGIGGFETNKYIEEAIKILAASCGRVGG